MVLDDSKFKKKVAKPTFKRGQIIRDDLFAVQQQVATVNLNKPIYLLWVCCFGAVKTNDVRLSL